MSTINTNHIVIEGLDGCGKSSIIHYLSSNNTIRKIMNSFVRKVEDVKYFKFDACPFDKNVSKAIRGLLKKDPKTSAYLSDELRAELLLKLFSVDNKIHNEFVKDLCEVKSNVLISDRSFLSTYAYQTLGNSEEKVDEMIKESIDQLPGLVIFLNVSPETSLSRINSRGEEKEIFEKKETLNKVRDNYIKYIKKLKEENKDITVVFIDADKEFEDVSNAVNSCIVDYLIFGENKMKTNNRYVLL